MRHLSLDVEIWGVFLITMGVGLLLFNRKWAAWATPQTFIQLIPIAPSAKTAVGRVMTVVVGLAFVVAGASVFLQIGPGPH